MKKASIFALFLIALCGPSQKEIDHKLQEANLLYEEHRLEDAMERYGDVLKDSPHNVPAGLMAGRILYFSHDYAKAQSMFEGILKDDENCIEALYWLARTQSAIPEKKAEAMKNLEHLLRLDRTRMDALLLKGKLHEERNETADALAAYSMITSQEHLIGETYSRLAHMYATVGLDSRRIEATARAAFLAPDLIAKKEKAQ